jgi:hypothetical protein
MHHCPGRYNRGIFAVPAANGVSANEELINTCVEKILEILKEKNGR